jgi:hypothetical protein
MTREGNIAAQERFGAAMNSGHLGAFDVLATVDVVAHERAPARAPGSEGYREIQLGVPAQLGLDPQL